MLWLFLLGAVTVLIIALRRVLRRQKPLSDTLYYQKVAIDHVPSGVAWVRGNGLIGSVNPALAVMLGVQPRELVGQEWRLLFPPREKERIREAYSETLLRGIAHLEVQAERPDGSLAPLSLSLVAVHDRRSRFVGHYCLTRDLSREQELQRQVTQVTAELTAALARQPMAAVR